MQSHLGTDFSWEVSGDCSEAQMEDAAGPAENKCLPGTSGVYLSQLQVT